MKMNILSAVNSALFEPSSSRKLSGVARNIAFILALAIALYHLWTFTLGRYDIFVHRSIHVGSILALCFITYSFKRKSTKVPIIDVVLAISCLGIMLYLVLNSDRLFWDRVALSTGSLKPWELVIGVVLILLVLEAGRRALGATLGLIALLSLVYAYIGGYISGMWNHIGFSFEQIIDFTVFSTQGIFGLPIGVCSTYIAMFLIFGSLLMVSGTGKFFTDLALAVAGKARGGPGKVAVIGSALFGTISGSGTANVVVTGSVTIPMMKRAGFKPYYAGAIECTAATGGAILPPVMGGSVFIMMELVGVSYWEICVLAFIPAILYYLGVFLQVHFYALRNNLTSVDTSIVQIPAISLTLKKGWHYSLPFIAIIALLFLGYSPIRTALWSMLITIAVSWFPWSGKEDRIGFRKMLKALESSMMMLRLIMLGTALSGILMGVVNLTGAGSVIMSTIRGFSGGMLLPALLLSAAFCLFLGLSLSSIAAYLLTAILVVPATVSLGVPPVAAHLFAIYFSNLAHITPPTGAAFFLAAAIAEAPPFKTGWQATKLAFASFLIPFVFVYRPALLLLGTLPAIAIAVATASAAVFIGAIAAEGYFIGKLHIAERLLLSLGVMLFTFGVATIQVTAGIVVVVVVLGIHWLRNRRVAPAEADMCPPDK